MSINFQEAMEEINKGFILACPECFNALQIDEKNKTMFCEIHGVIVPNLENKGE
jgi:hypothetical protein